MDTRRLILESLVCAAQQGDSSVLRWGNGDVETYLQGSGGDRRAIRNELAADFESRAGHTDLAPRILLMIREGLSGEDPADDSVRSTPKPPIWALLYQKLRPANSSRSRISG